MKIKEIVSPTTCLDKKQQKFTDRISLPQDRLIELCQQMNKGTRKVMEEYKSCFKTAIDTKPTKESFEAAQKLRTLIGNDVDFLSNTCAEIEVNSYAELAYLMFAANLKREDILDQMPTDVKMGLEVLCKFGGSMFGKSNEQDDLLTQIKSFINKDENKN